MALICQPCAKQNQASSYSATGVSGAAEWTATYDDLDRPLTITTPDGAVVTTTYSGNKVDVV